MISLETYLRTLGAFLQAANHGTMVNRLYEKNTQLAYLRLSISGAWEIATLPPNMLAPATVTDIVIPLVLPLSPIILVAHGEAQWARNQPGAAVASLCPR